MRKIATLVGCAIGDALGNPFEMKPPISPALVEWDGLFKAGGTFWKGEAGQYTDDTLMTIALSKSLLQCNGFDAEDVAKEYLAWYETGNTRGIGNTTAEACSRLLDGVAWQESGLTGLDKAGNGSAMRASPIGLVYRKDIDSLIGHAMADASITHNSNEPKMGSIAVALGTAYLAGHSKYDRDAILAEIIYILEDCDVRGKLQQASFHLAEGTDPKIALAEIGSSGYVAETVGAAFYCLNKTNSFKECVIMAIKCGGDTDTTAAVAGALAGTYYGLDAIPNEYKNQVENFELLNALNEELINMKI